MILADGRTWSIIAGNEQASLIVSHLKNIMCLCSLKKPAQQLFVLVENHNAHSIVAEDLFFRLTLPFQSQGPVVCTLKPTGGDVTFVRQLMGASLGICLDAEHRGGVLIHGALAENEGRGVILAGPDGIGKTTASLRLLHPWRSLCDDLTLVVRDQRGTYWAHPWPTWSRFINGREGGAWKVEDAVPLKGIFFLSRSQQEHIKPVGVGQTTCLLVDSAEQAWWRLLRGVAEDMIRKIRLQRFQNICSLAQTVPGYLLHLSLTGAFWQKIEKFI
jgi:SynChlorMet cassette protein ScmC